MIGIDISHHNGWPFDYQTAQAYKDSDFVIVKATQWESNYKFEGYFAPAIEKTLSDGKLGGAYHYATGKDPIKEADYFLSVVKPYLGKIILALDWEEGQNDSWNKSTTWCKMFVDRVKEKTGITCFLYNGMDGLDDCANLANQVPLWFAGYPKNENSWDIPTWPSRYKTYPWKAFKIWQFTSAGCDRNVTAMTVSEWRAFCKTKVKEPDPKKKYSGEFPSLPSRGYYTLGDGYRQNPGLVMDIKKLQKLVNWINGGSIKVDGAYGNNTVAAVKLAQTALKVKVDGLFGSKTLFAAKAYKK